MGDGQISAVSDAGPLIHLAEVDCLPLLSIFGPLHIPNAVWQETVELGRVIATELLTLGNVQRHVSAEEEVIRFVDQNSLDKLHAGERECLYLCRQLSVSVLLTDDLAVRETACILGLRPVGSLGVVMRACLDGRISLSTAERCMTDLYSVSSLYVTGSIVRMAIEQLHMLHTTGGT